MSREAEFWTKVEKSEGCWLWRGIVTKDGYGVFSYRGQTKVPHRLAYEWLVGPIPDGLQIDHLCRNRLCVNPAHMEPVTMYENIMRGQSRAAQNARKTHCKRGHEFTPENTVVKMRRGRETRVCRTCRTEYEHDYYRRRKAAATC